MTAVALPGHVAGMAKATQKRKSSPRRKRRSKPPSLWARTRLWALRGLLGLGAAVLALVCLFAVIRPPTTPYILAEGLRHGEVRRDWVPMEEIAPVMARSVVAAEDANYCLHWGFDMGAIREALEEGANRGASTISQQTVKNVFLWQGRSWPRKALESLLTPVVELDQGVFGVGAAAEHYFGVSAKDLNATQAARLAAILPDPKGRSAKTPSDFVRRRAAQIADGAATIRADGRAACFER